MKKTLLILIVTLFATIAANGQNLFFIGEKSYPCTETFTLESNSNSRLNDLDILIAKDGTKGLFVVSIETIKGMLIRGKLIIYLDDGTVITCIDKGKYDYVDNVATTVYYLTADQLTKMKNNNINTVRYTLKCRDCYYSSDKGNFSASNNANLIGKYVVSEKTDVPTLINNLFN
jgi:hypothetical protein